MDPRLTEEAQQRPVGVPRDGVLHHGDGDARAAATRATWYAAASGLMSGSSPDADAVTRSIGIGALPFASRSRSTSAWIRSISARLVGPRLEPPDAMPS